MDDTPRDTPPAHPCILPKISILEKDEPVEIETRDIRKYHLPMTDTLLCDDLSDLISVRILDDDRMCERWEGKWEKSGHIYPDTENEKEKGEEYDDDFFRKKVHTFIV